MSDSIDLIFFDIKECRDCELHSTRTLIVRDKEFLASPSIVIIGEAPGGHEDTVSGVPFTGQAGENLNRFLSLVKLKKEEIYITNLVKCRPTKESKRPRYGNYANRTPKSGEIKVCKKFLQRELELLNPKYIVTLGAVPLKYFTNEGIKDVHGTVIKGNVFPLYHPGSITYNRDLLKTYEEDLSKLSQLVNPSEDI